MFISKKEVHKNVNLIFYFVNVSVDIMYMYTYQNKYNKFQNVAQSHVKRDKCKCMHARVVLRLCVW